jgi:hypothetical protein
MAASVDGRQFLHGVARFGTLDGKLGVAGAGEIHARVKAVERADVLEILLLVGGVDAQEVVVLGDLVDQDVVHEAAVLVEQPGVVRLADLQLVDGIGGDEIGELAASGPWISISPMWLTSKTPTARRTAWCSSMIPVYWTGMSHPPKSTILAPRAR